MAIGILLRFSIMREGAHHTFLWWGFPTSTILSNLNLYNVRGEPVFSVLAAGCFCEKSGWIGKVEDVKLVLLNIKRTSTGNHFEEEDFYLDELWNRRISSIDSSRAIYHLVLWVRLFVHCRVVAVWWLANMQSFCFIIRFHNFATLETRLTY